jgi:hypothetical protein
MWLAGFSFGARVALSVGVGSVGGDGSVGGVGNGVVGSVGLPDPRVSKLLGVGLAVRMFDLSFLERDRGGKPLAVVQAADDEYGGRSEIEAFVNRIPAPKHLWIVEQATHLFPGKLDELEAAVGEAIDWLDAPSAPHVPHVPST